MQLFLFIARANPAETTNNPAVRSAPKWWLVGQTVAIYGIEIRASPLLPTFNFNRKIKNWFDFFFCWNSLERQLPIYLSAGNRPSFWTISFSFFFWGGKKITKIRSCAFAGQKWKPFNWCEADNTGLTCSPKNKKNAWFLLKNKVSIYSSR